MSGWLFHDFVATSFLMLTVLALRRPVARLFGAGWAYALWLVPALRFVLPPLPWPDLRLPAEVSIPTPAGVTASLPASAGPGQWVPLLLAIWAGGAVIFLILQWLGYRGFARRLAGSARPTRPPLYRGIATFVSALVEGPLAIGLIEPRIVVPADFSRRYSPGERRLAMEHERIHHRHRDIWWNMAATFLLAANWFNPIAWLAFRAFRTDQELACDASVAARAGPEERHDYARALVKSASRPGLIAACPMNNAGALKRRLRMMGLHRVSPARSAGGVAALAAMALAGAGVGGIREAPPRAAFDLPAPPRVAFAMRASPRADAAPVRLAAAAIASPPIVVTAPRRTVRAARPVRARISPLQAAPESAGEGTELALAEPMPPAPPPDPAAPPAARAPAPATVYRLADGALVFRIDGASGPVLIKARKLEGRTRIYIRLAQAVRSGPDGAGRLTLQMDEQGDWND
jgi:beta-lactamase regulating signal transducer with metallopeptidase domain